MVCWHYRSRYARHRNMTVSLVSGNCFSHSCVTVYCTVAVVGSRLSHQLLIDFLNKTRSQSWMKMNNDTTRQCPRQMVIFGFNWVTASASDLLCQQLTVPWVNKYIVVNALGWSIHWSQKCLWLLLVMRRRRAQVFTRRNHFIKFDWWKLHSHPHSYTHIFGNNSSDS